MKKAKALKQSSATSLHQLTFVLQQSADELLIKQAKVGLAQVRILSCLDVSVPSSQRTVAMKLGQSEANVSRQLHSMKQHGLVKVTRNKKDARQRDVALTTKGGSKYKQAERLLATQHKGLMKLVPSADAKVFDNTINHLILALNVEVRQSNKL